MPFSLALLVLPICLHKESRIIISGNPRRYFLKTIGANPQIRLNLADRTRNLLPFTFEALGFTFHLGSFEITAEARLRMRKRGIRKKIDGTEESVECQKVARIIGRNFAKIADRATIYTSLGVRP